MQVQARIVAWRSVVNELLLPGCDDQMHSCDLLARKQAAGEIDGMALHARELAGR
jgi:hypothetical protein